MRCRFAIGAGPAHTAIPFDDNKFSSATHFHHTALSQFPLTTVRASGRLNLGGDYVTFSSRPTNRGASGPRRCNRNASGSRRGGRGASGSRIRHFLCIANQNRACTLGSGNRHASGSRISRHRRFCFKKHGRCEQARNQGPSTDDRVFRNG